MVDLEQFSFKEKIQIRWNDLDPLGHVNNSLFVTYFEVARGFYMLNASPKWDWKKDMFLIGNVNVNFHKELTLFNLNTSVFMRTKVIGTKSFVLEYVVVSEDFNNKKTIHASGETTQIMFDMKDKKTIEIKDWLKEHILSFEKKDTVALKS